VNRAPRPARKELKEETQAAAGPVGVPPLLFVFAGLYTSSELAAAVLFLTMRHALSVASAAGNGFVNNLFKC
jgi:hypothetical protein